MRIVSLSELPLTLMHLLADDGERRALGRRAKETILSQMGATSRTLEAIRALLLQEREAHNVSAARKE